MAPVALPRCCFCGGRIIGLEAQDCLLPAYSLEEDKASRRIEAGGWTGAAHQQCLLLGTQRGLVARRPAAALTVPAAEESAVTRHYNPLIYPELAEGGSLSAALDAAGAGAALGFIDQDSWAGPVRAVAARGSREVAVGVALREREFVLNFTDTGISWPGPPLRTSQGPPWPPRAGCRG